MSQHDAPQSKPKDAPSPQPTAEEALPERATQLFDSLAGAIINPNEDNLTPRVIRALQHTHGNRFVQRLIQRARPRFPLLQRVVVNTPVSYRRGRDIERMTLGDFHQLTQDQTNWFNGPGISAEQRTQFSMVLEFSHRPHILAGCRNMTIRNLLRAGLLDGSNSLNFRVTDPLQTYSKGVANQGDSIQVSPQTNVARAIRWGQAMEQLQTGIGGDLAHRTIRQAGFERLLRRGYIQDFIDYFRQFSPNLEDPEGTEITSYLALRGEGVNPVSYAGGVLQGKIKDFHRFQRAALDRLVRNFGLSGRPDSERKPLTLIIHSSSDHNAAFHRDPNLTAVITSSRSTTLMLEVITSLADIQSQIPTLARDYGKGGRIDQVMFAGHGNARSIQMMPDQPGGAASQDLNLDTNRTQTEALFTTLLNNMASDPATSTFRRIVFNACLTGSNEVTLPPGTTRLPADPTQAMAMARQRITDNPAFATFLRQRVPGDTIRVIGANGSISTVRLMNSRGALDIITSEDPEVTNDDKLVYVERGTEPEGVMRAVMECWSGFGAPDPVRRQQACFQAMERRVRGSTTDWRETIIRTIFRIILDRYRTDGEMIRRMGPAAYALAELVHESECKVQNLEHGGLLPGGGMAAEAVNLFTPLRRTGEWGSLNYIPLVVEQVWMMHDASHQANFLAALRPFDGQTVSPSHGGYLHPTPLLPVLGALLPVGATPTRERLLLACKIIARVDNADARAFLLDVIGAGNRRFPARLRINDILQGNPDEQVVLTRLNLVAASTNQRANLDLDHDGTNETFVEPTPGMRGMTVLGPAIVYERPDVTSPQLNPPVAANQMVRVSGQTAGFYAIEYSGARSGVAFVEQSRLLPM